MTRLEQEETIVRLQEALNDVTEALGYGHPRTVALDIAVAALVKDPMKEEQDG